jgi:2-epi-5-epi-valiolone synthase
MDNESSVAQVSTTAQGATSLPLHWRVRPDRKQTYDVLVAEPLFDELSDVPLRGGSVPGRRFVVIDSGVPAAWRTKIRTYFKSHSVMTSLMVVPGGEAFKDIDNVLQLIKAFDDFELDRRNEPVIVIGGGAVLDTAGLAANLYRRGVPHIRVPSTLLAYVDASISIKTGVNFGSGKNLVGTFAAPLSVLLDRAFLRSLPHREISSGLGEILKLALACDRELFAALEQGADQFRSSQFSDESGLRLLTRAISVMLDELEPDMYEDNLYRSVDLGHTFSQPFELLVGPAAMRHGEAVALDLNLSAVISHNRGILDSAALHRLVCLTKRLGLPTVFPDIEPELLWRSVIERTRHRAGKQRIPLPTRIGGHTFVDDVKPGEVAESLRILRALLSA